MQKPLLILSSYEYKKQFLPDINTRILYDKSHLQLYRIEHYLKEIVIPVPPYRTSFNFMVFVTKGFLRQQLESENYIVGPGQILNIKRGSITRTHELSDDIEGFYLIYESDVVTTVTLSQQDFTFFSSSPFANIPEQLHSWMTKAFELLEEELHAAATQDAVSIALFRSILLKIIAQLPHKPLAIARELEIMHKFRELVQQQHSEHKEVSFYARTLNISETYLNKCVKKATGKPPKQWINEVCILHSQILLRDMGRDIADVADSLNFQSLSHFSRMFKKVTGKSPSAFRADNTSGEQAKSV
ncbi:helix-turn-helix domain-containing protein [Taibaiella soli]|uniref:AraC family transcriptional regulator n=1 Tax=Taibaiella soli TaxID=1649169 RepID=A0A2W2AA25_9BACT|nr:AraC family transcriptional regulator [Taibaiella soli]PZF72245.1 AraC family transcriptional regulator [Taibaiella soli]